MIRRYPDGYLKAEALYTQNELNDFYAEGLSEEEKEQRRLVVLEKRKEFASLYGEIRNSGHGS